MEKKGTRVDVPSQNTVPQQRRYPVETAANQTMQTTACPYVSEPNGSRDFSMPKPRDEFAIRAADGVFNHRSTTNGKE